MAVIAEDWRKGQVAFNFVWLVAPDLANEVRGDLQLDPYYKDDNLDRFWEHLHKKVTT